MLNAIQLRNLLNGLSSSYSKHQNIPPPPPPKKENTIKVEFCDVVFKRLVSCNKLKQKLSKKAFIVQLAFVNESRTCSNYCFLFFSYMHNNVHKLKD